MRRRGVRPCHLHTVEPRQTNKAPAVQHNDMQLYLVSYSCCSRSRSLLTCICSRAITCSCIAAMHAFASCHTAACCCSRLCCIAALACKAAQHHVKKADRCRCAQAGITAWWHSKNSARSTGLKAQCRCGSGMRHGSKFCVIFTLAWRSTRVQCSQKSSGLPWRRSRSRCVVARCVCCRFRRCRAWWPSHPQNALRVRMWYCLMCWMAS